MSFSNKNCQMHKKKSHVGLYCLCPLTGIVRTGFLVSFFEEDMSPSFLLCHNILCLKVQVVAKTIMCIFAYTWHFPNLDLCPIIFPSFRLLVLPRR
jgi:hypothetical protein